MARWEPGTRERLQSAALDLYLSRGFEQTTTEEIARTVGVTERTFFRHFADKREVLFDGQNQLEDALVRAVVDAPPEAGPLALITLALDAAGEFFSEQRRTHSRRRQRVIDSHPALQERELLKLTHLARALAQALREHGVADPAAELTAGTGLIVFIQSFRAWLSPEETRTYQELERGLLRELGAVVHPTAAS